MTGDHRQVSDIWEHGDPYEQFIGRWSRRVAPLFLSWLRIPSGQRWLDVGCGTGALSAAIVDYCSSSSLVAVEPSEGFLTRAREHLEGRATLYRGSATEIPLEDSSADVVVSGLVLNFVPAPHSALVEMARVTRDGGTIGAYVWDYAGKMEILRYFWDAAISLSPDVARIAEGNRFPLCHPEALRELFASAGLKEIEGTAIEIQTPFASFEDYWQPFLGGQGPAPTYTMSLDETARTRLRERIRERIPIESDGTILLTARAWSVRAAVEK